MTALAVLVPWPVGMVQVPAYDAATEPGILTIKTDIAEHGYAASETLLTATFTSAAGYFGNVSSADNTFAATSVTYSGPP